MESSAISVDAFAAKLKSLGFSDAEAALVREAFSGRSFFQRNDNIVLQGAGTTACRALMDGHVCRYKIADDGQRQIVSLHVPGDLFDIQSFALERADYNVAAITACTVADISRDDLRILTGRHPRMARALWRESLVDASISREWILNIGRRSAYQRLAHVMCEIYMRLGLVGLADHGTMPWPYRQSDVADATGLSVVHVNRSLQQLRRDGLVEQQNMRLIIKDWEGLKATAGFQDDYLHVKGRGSEARSREPTISTS